MAKPRPKGSYTLKKAEWPWNRNHWHAELFRKGSKKYVAIVVRPTLKEVFKSLKRLADKHRLDVTFTPPSKIPSGLTPEDRANIASLQERKRQVGMYGDDSGVRSEQRAIQGQINRIKDEAARRAALGLKGSGVQPRVPLNLYVDR